MSRLAKGGRKRAPKPLAIATLDERIEYAVRANIANHKKLEAIAAAKDMDDYGEELKNRYNLPSAFDFNLQTGHLTERQPDAEE